MGCCSGRCTLAFICGMQLVSVYVTIDPVRGGKSGLKSSTNRQVLMGKKKKRHLYLEVEQEERWVAGERERWITQRSHFRS